MSEAAMERVRAYDELEALIRRITAMEGWDGLLTDWIVISAHQQLDDEGHDVTAIGRLLPGGGYRIPWYRCIGLLDYALTGFRNEIRDGADDDETA